METGNEAPLKALIHCTSGRRRLSGLANFAIQNPACRQWKLPVDIDVYDDEAEERKYVLSYNTVGVDKGGAGEKPVSLGHRFMLAWEDISKLGLNILSQKLSGMQCLYMLGGKASNGSMREGLRGYINIAGFIATRNAATQDAAARIKFEPCIEAIDAIGGNDVREWLTGKKDHSGILQQLETAMSGGMENAETRAANVTAILQQFANMQAGKWVGLGIAAKPTAEQKLAVEIAKDTAAKVALAPCDTARAIISGNIAGMATPHYILLDAIYHLDTATAQVTVDAVKTQDTAFGRAVAAQLVTRANKGSITANAAVDAAKATALAPIVAHENPAPVAHSTKAKKIASKK